MKEITISANDAGQRIDRFLQKMLPSLPPSLMYRYLRTRRIKLNGGRCAGADMLSPGDMLQLYLNDEFFVPPQSENSFQLAGSRLNILYEDENVLLLDKELGLVVHEDESGGADTLINRVRRYLCEKGEYDPRAEQSFAPALCNRIDRNTGGIVIAAKNAASLRVMNELIRLRLVDKRYLCVVHGRPEPETATLRNYLKKDEKRNLVEVYDRPAPGALTALTRYRVIETRGRFSLLEAELLTGRTHQIRAQLAHIGHPLLGDAKYGVNRDNRGTGYRFQALYAYRLTFLEAPEAGHLSYLCGQSFEVKDILFRTDFCAGRIV